METPLKLPLRVDRWGTVRDAHANVIVTTGLSLTTGVWKDDTPERVRDYLVRAANCHDELVAVAEEVRAALQGYRDRLTEAGCESWIDDERLLAGLNAVLARVDGEAPPC